MPSQQLAVVGSGKTRKVGAPLSLIGSNLAKRAPQAPTSPSGAKAIVDRYAREVREADRARKVSYLPMQEQMNFKPAGFDIARDMQADLASLICKETKHLDSARVGGAHLVSILGTEKRSGWDAILSAETFQKRLQFLHQHARTGHFMEQYGDDGTYEGEFQNGMRHGKGKYQFRNQSGMEEVYDGEWKWDQRHGWGTLSCGDGTSIKGEWQNGKTHGFACVIDQRGTVIYEGEFKEGKRHGLGRQVFESGDMYDGGWQAGRLHDRGVYYFTNGDRLLGMWKEGIYDGVGVFHYADGSISRREYSNGLLMSVQDYDHSVGVTQRDGTIRLGKFGKTLTRGGMQRHTHDRDFPKEVFLLNSV